MSGRTGWAFRAARPDGVLEAGVLEAASRETAAALLSERGLFPVEVRPAEEESGSGTRLSAEELALGFRPLATLLESGLPLSQALVALDELAPPRWVEALPAVRESVRQGRGLAQALADAPLGLPPVALGILRAGEAGSGLGPAVRRAAELLEAQAAARVALRSALAYPLLLAGAGLVSVGLLVGIVLPRFAAILADLGQSLPTSTRALLAVSDLVRAGTPAALLLVPVGVVGWRRWTRTPAGLLRWHGFLLSVPVAGRVRASAAAARVSQALAALLASGVPLAPALLHATAAAGDAAVETRLRAARARVVRGEPLARALEEEGALTSAAVRLVRAGERSGTLGAMLGRAAELERERAEREVGRALRYLEPALIVGFGLLVTLVAAALLQAVYGVRPLP